MITAKKIEEIIKTGSQHCLYKSNGNWYHHLREFPGTLFDINGYIIFNSKEEYESCGQLKHGINLHVNIGIFQIPGYQQFTLKDKEEILKMI